MGRLLSLALAMLAVSPLHSQEDEEGPALSARLVPNVVGLGQETVLEIRVEVKSMRLLRVHPRFQLENLTTVAGPFQEQSVQFVNGSISNSTTLRWRLRPTEVGPGRVTQIEVDVGDQTLTASALDITIQEERVPEAEPRRPRDPFESIFGDTRDPFRDRAATQPELYLRAQVNPVEPYVGQQIRYTLYLYTRNNVTAVNAEEVPGFEGFWTEEPPADSVAKRPEEVSIDGRRWLRVPLLERVLYPLRPGELEIDPATMAFEVAPDRNGFFRRSQAVRRTSPGTQINVRPLPAGGPTGSSVGRIRLESSLEPQKVEAGEAAQLVVTARGRGNLRRMPDPVFDPPVGMEIYPPQGDSTHRFTSDGAEFTRSWRWVVVPQEAGTFTLPSLSVPYFDPRTESFQQVSTPAHQLSVTRPATAQRTPTPQLPVAQLHPVRTVAVAAIERRARLPVLWFLIAGVVATAVMIWRDTQESRGLPPNTDSHGSSSSLGSSSRLPTRKALQQQIEQISANDPRRAAIALESVMRSYLTDRWGLTGASAPEVWADTLANSGLSLAALDRLRSVTEDMHYLRYAPQLSQTEQLSEDLKRSALEWTQRLPRR